MATRKGLRPTTFPKPLTRAPAGTLRPPMPHNKAYIVGEFRQNDRGERVLVAIDVKSEAHPTMISGLRWCSFGDESFGGLGMTFGDAVRAATPRLVELRQLFFGRHRR